MISLDHQHFLEPGVVAWQEDSEFKTMLNYLVRPCLWTLKPSKTKPNIYLPASATGQKDGVEGDTVGIWRWEKNRPSRSGWAQGHVSCEESGGSGANATDMVRENYKPHVFFKSYML